MNHVLDHADDVRLSIHRNTAEIYLISGGDIQYFFALLKSTYNSPCIENVKAGKHRALTAWAVQ